VAIEVTVAQGCRMAVEQALLALSACGPLSQPRARDAIDGVAMRTDDDRVIRHHLPRFLRIADILELHIDDNPAACVRTLRGAGRGAR
jgi:hypothetical protein